MQTVVIHDLDDKKTDILKALASYWKKAIDVRIDDDQENAEHQIFVDEKGVRYYYLNGIRIDLAKTELLLEEISGSLTDLNLDAKALRKKWDRSHKF